MLFARRYAAFVDASPLRLMVVTPAYAVAAVDTLHYAAAADAFSP